MRASAPWTAGIIGKAKSPRDFFLQTMSTNHQPAPGEPSRQSGQSNLPMLCIAWLVVGIPLGWGVVKSVEKSLPLFNGRPAAAPVPPSSGAR